MGNVIQFKARQEEDIKNIYWGIPGSLLNESGEMLSEIEDNVLQSDKKNYFKIIPLNEYSDLFEKIRYNFYLHPPHAIVIQDDFKLKYSRRDEVEILFDLNKYEFLFDIIVDTVNKIKAYHILDKFTKKFYSKDYFQILQVSLQNQVKETNDLLINFKPTPKLIIVNNQLYGFSSEIIKKYQGKYFDLLNSIQDNNENVYVINDFEEDFNWGIVEPSLVGIEKILGL